MPQILINSIISGTVLSLMAIGFSYIFKVTKVFHIAHAGIYVVSAYICWSFYLYIRNWSISILLTILTTIIIIYILEKLVYLPLSKTTTNQSISLISSMGLYIIIINILAGIYGNENKIFEQALINPIQNFGIIITSAQLIQFISSTIAIILLLLYLSFSKSDLIFQSIADNEIISKTYGVNIVKERTKVFIIGSILAAVASIITTLDTGIDPQAGMNITLTAAVVSILTNRLNILWIVLFSICIKIFQNYIEFFLNAQYRDGITFLILLIIILYKTEGIINYDLRRDQS